MTRSDPLAQLMLGELSEAPALETKEIRMQTLMNRMNKESKPLAAEAETPPRKHPFQKMLPELAVWCLLAFGVVGSLLLWMHIIWVHIIPRAVGAN